MTKDVGQKIWKVILFLIKILRWPVVYYGGLIGGFFAIAWIFSVAKGEEVPLYEVVGQHALVISGILVAFMLVVSFLTSTFFTETFLVSTGLATGMYLLGSFFLSAPNNWASDYVEFDMMKMVVILILVIAVLLGDIIAFIVRKILNKRNVQNIMKND